MDGEAKKFVFETEFSADGSVIIHDDSWRQSVPREEVDGLLEQARAEGVQSADLQATQALEQICQTLSAQMRDMLAQCSQVARQMREESAQFALIVANKLSGAALSKFEQVQLQDIVSRTLVELKGAPAIQITVPEAAAHDLSESLKTLIEDSEFGGSIRIYGDTNANAGSVTLEWQEGMVRFDPGEVAERVQQEVANWLASQQAMEEQQENREPEHG